MTGIAAEATLAGIAFGQGIEGLFCQRVLIEAFFEDGFYRAVARIVVGQGSLAGSLQANSAIFLLESDNALGGTQIFQHRIRVWQAAPIWLD